MRYLILLLSLLFAAPLWAADGDACDSGTYKGIANTATCIYLCDGKVDPATCPRYNVDRKYDFVAIELAQATNCSACSITVTTVSKSSGGIEHTLGTLDCTGTTLLSLNGQGAHPLAYIEADITSETACDTTGIDVLFHGLR